MPTEPTDSRADAGPLRRRVLRAGAAVVLWVAGCLGGESPEGTSGSPESTGAGETATPSPTITETSAPASAAADPDGGSGAVFYTPEPAPELPDQVEAFDPPALADVGGEAAAITRASRTAGPGTEIYVAGHGMTGELLVYGAGSGTELQTTVRPSGDVDADGGLVQLPTALPEWGLTLIYPTAEGAGRPAVVNRAEPWSALPSHPEPGETVTVIGRNLSHADGTETAWVYLNPTDETTTGQWAAVGDVNPYKVEFRVPELEDGDYEVWLHNGHGGQYGWCPLHAGFGGATTETNHFLTVGTTVDWDAGSTIDVTAEGADPSPGGDDTAAIRSALEAANEADVATVYFPEGTYTVSETLGPIKYRVRLRGDGAAVTTVRGHPDDPPDPTVRGTGHHIELRDITFKTAPDDAAENGAADGVKLYRSEDYPKGFTIQDCILKALGDQALRFDGGPTQVRFIDTDFIGGGVEIGTATEVLIEGCRFYGVKDLNIILYGLGNRAFIMKNSEGHNWTNEPGEYAVGRWYTIAGWQRQANCYIGNCKTVDLGPRDGLSDQNQGEQIMFEFYKSVGQQGIEGAGPQSVTFKRAMPEDDVRWYGTAVVTAGRGIGQYRQIGPYDPESGEAKLKRPWDIVPDSESTVAVMRSVNRMVLYGNEFTGRDRMWQADHHIASNGITMFGPALDMIVDSNTFRKVGGGITAFGLGGHASNRTGWKQYFHLYRNNTIEQVKKAVRFRGAGVGKEQDAPGPTGFGWSVRSNRIRTTREAAVHIGQGTVEGNRFRAIDRLTIENNELRNIPTGVDIQGTDASIGAVAILRNSITRGTADPTESEGISVPPAVRLADNEISGFETSISNE